MGGCGLWQCLSRTQVLGCCPCDVSMDPRILGGICEVEGFGVDHGCVDVAFEVEGVVPWVVVLTWGEG